tara:strand:- start:1700 stop:1936 length:237 start_codon:yes stop_codon:yes gene_type:complete
MFESLVWSRALLGEHPYTKVDYKKTEDFYPCEVLEVAGNYILVAPLYFRPVWIISNLVQISEDTYYELMKEKDSDTTT